MGLTRHHGLTGRLLLTVGFSTILPLTVLMGVVLFEVYQATAAQNQQALEQVGRRYAAELEVRMTEKLGLVRAMAALAPHVEDELLTTHLRELDPDITEAWVRRPDTKASLGPNDETPWQKALYVTVGLRQAEVLSPPDLVHENASLGYPIVDQGRFRGMVAISFPLASFQKTIGAIRLFDHGYAFLAAHDGTRIAHPDQSLVGVKVGNDMPPEQAQAVLRQIDTGVAFSFEKHALATGLWSRQFYSPVTVGRAQNPWFLVTVIPVAEANRDIDRLFTVVIGGLVLTLVLVAWLTWRAARSVVRPLKQLAASAEDVATGHLDTRMPTDLDDEVGQLALSFNRMTDRLVTTLQGQEDLVRKRTESLRQSLADLEHAQAKILDTEKMAVLGQLMATIAHEINTPLGAIRSSATFLNQASARFSDYPDFMRSVDTADFEWYKTLVVQKGTNLAAPTNLEDRRRRRALSLRFQKSQLADPQGLADDIVFLVGPDQEPFLADAAEHGKAAVIRFASLTVAQLQSSAIILEASDRAAATVAALVDYSRNTNLVAEQLIDPAREINTLLTLYYGLSKRGVEVVREFEPGTVVRGDRDKLNQVWVNLINNALQAMDYRGRLVIRIRSVGAEVEVAVANDGPRVPDHLREKIFEPFFTTKTTGEGTGLGLDICRRIVDAHRGSLSLTDEGVYTVFAVRLPAPSPRSPS